MISQATHLHRQTHDAEGIRYWRTSPWLNVQQPPEQTVPDKLARLQLPIPVAWLVAYKHAQSSRERLLLLTQQGNTNRKLTIVVGRAVALRAANSVFFLSQSQDLSCGVNRSTMCGRSIPLLLALAWRMPKIEMQRWNVAAQFKFVWCKTKRRENCGAEVVLHFSALYGLMSK